MNTHQFKFQFSDMEYIEIKMHSLQEALHCCTQIPMIYCMPSQEILLSIGSVKNNMYMFAKLLRKALVQNLKVDASIQKDIGYLYNQDLHEGRSDLKYETFGALEFWVGESYKLWAYQSASWLYNDKDGNIVFKITPVYIPENQIFNQIKYQEFMNRYAPLHTKIISHETAQILLHKAESLLHDIEDHIQAGHHNH